MNQKTKNKRKKKIRCKSKVRYKSKAEASFWAGYYTAKNSIEKGYYQKMNAYWCEIHHCWHIGNDNKHAKSYTELSWTMKGDNYDKPRNSQKMAGSGPEARAHQIRVCSHS